MRRDFDKQRHWRLSVITLLQLAVPSLQCDQQGSELIRLLQLSQLRCVWGADVDRYVVSEFIDEVETREIVCRSFFDRHDLAFADADTKDAIFGSIMFDASRERGSPRVVEPGAIDERLIRGESKHARLRITRLRMKRHRSRFDKTKTQRCQRFKRNTILIKTGRKSHRIPET